MDKRVTILNNLYTHKLIGENYISPVNYKIENKTNYLNFENSNLTQLSGYCKECTLCSLSKYRKKSLFSYGNGKNGLFIILPEPNSSEISNGIFYSGNSGEMLKNMIINVLKLDTKETYLTTVLKCQTPTNRTAAEEEIKTCCNYLKKQLDILQPKLILMVGTDVYKYLTNNDNFDIINGTRFKYYNYNAYTIYHPQKLIKNPTLKKNVYNMLLYIKSQML